MKEKDLNKFYQENELDRLKGILFPKKNKKTPEGSTVETQTLIKPKHIETSLRTDIEKLRTEIHTMLEKGKNKQI